MVRRIGLTCDRRCILYIVTRTQLYLDEEVLSRLKELSRVRKTTISALVREAIEQTYFRTRLPSDWSQILDEATGLWKDRTDLPDTEVFLRSLRDDSKRRKRIWRK